eukprot:3538037-Rhodomonas_salina.3
MHCPVLRYAVLLPGQCAMPRSTRLSRCATRYVFTRVLCDARYGRSVWNNLLLLCDVLVSGLPYYDSLYDRYFARYGPMRLMRYASLCCDDPDTKHPVLSDRIAGTTPRRVSVRLYAEYAWLLPYPSPNAEH